MSNMDDPRDILKAAGVECAEVEAYADADTQFNPIHVEQFEHSFIDEDKADAAIIALARLVAKQRGMLELAYTDYEARWNPDWGSFRQRDAWLSDLEADNDRPDA